MINAKNSAYGSPEKRANCAAVHSSNQVFGSVNKYKDNDVTHGQCNTKHDNPIIRSGAKGTLNKDKWTPKTTGAWTQPKNQKLTL
mmetsp:Transcript_18075/g.13022  ORF Transcript_18075/g.13022 Transcript_18075/m.13022 type:complete len:85 (+) Transcript_18075:439-693(+)|eukprot:CAMPEP_0116888722 /NCGR_PEP_ID=MMETSP0463-20121206/23902_1 /TAXON_ID=181622 /ORGANISM="Strombidinopsis sp, Strain SopsisLIS2011" /LENGTH=84 /DNA_ID=CAMNT_0004554087 /DNA_START=436 /DNA_END=693 /DNA_ORIENTATION=-